MTQQASKQVIKLPSNQFESIKSFLLLLLFFPNRFSSSLYCWRTPSTHLCPLNFCPLTLLGPMTVNLVPSHARWLRWKCRIPRTAPHTTGPWRSSGMHGCVVVVVKCFCELVSCFCSHLRKGPTWGSLLFKVNHWFNPFAAESCICQVFTLLIPRGTNEICFSVSHCMFRSAEKCQSEQFYVMVWKL